MNSLAHADLASELFQALARILNSSQLADLAIKYAAAKRLDQALQLAQFITDTFSRSRTLAEIVGQFIEDGQAEQAANTLARALSEAQTLQSPAEKAPALAEIAANYIKLGGKERASDLFTQAIEVARTIQDGGWNGDHELKLIVYQLAKVSLYDQALQVVQTVMWSNENKDDALAEIARRYISEAQLEQASEVAILIEDGYEQAPVLAEIALQYGATGQEEIASNLFTQTIAAANLADKHLSEGRNRVLVQIAAECARAKRYDQAFEFAELIDKPDYNVEALIDVASAAAINEQRDLAIEVLAKARKVIPTLEHDFDKTSALKDSAIAYAKAEQYEQAIKIAKTISEADRDRYEAVAQIAIQAAAKGHIKQSFEIFRTQKPYDFAHGYITEALSELAIRCFKSRKLGEASEVFSKALQAAMNIKTTPRSSNPSRLLIEMIGLEEKGELIGDKYDFKRDALVAIVVKYAEAELYSQALQVARIVAQRDEAEQLMQRGEELYGNVQIEAAIQSWQQALAIYREIDDRQGREEASSYLKHANQFQIDHAKLLESLKGIRQIQAISEPEEAIRVIFTTLTADYYQVKDYAAGIQVAELLLENAPDESNLKYAAIGLLGIVYRFLGESEKALEYLEQYQEHAAQVGGDLAVANALSNLGLAHLSLGDVKKAIDYLQQALSIAKTAGAFNLEKAYTINLGYIYLAQANYSLAIKTFHKVSRSILFSQIKSLSREWIEHILPWFTSNLFIPDLPLETDVHLQVQLLNGIGIALAEMGNFTAAIWYFTRSLSVADQINQEQKWDMIIKAAGSFAQHSAAVYLITPERGETLTYLGITLFKAGNLVEAEECLNEAIKVWSELLRNSINSDTAKVLFFERQAPIYRLLQKVLIAQDKVSAALEAAEAGRARAFVDLLARRHLTQDSYPVNLQERLADFRRQFTAHQQGMMHASMTEVPSMEKMQAIAKQHNATLVEYSVIYESDTQFKLSGRQEQCEAELFVWVIQPTGEVTFRQVDLKLLQQQGTSLKNLVAIVRKSIGVTERFIERDIKTHPEDEVGDGANHTQQLRHLYELLIQPIADLLPANSTDKVIFIPQGALFLAPFPALQDASGKYLIEKFSILSASSIQVLELTHEQREKVQQANSSEVLVMGNPTMPSFSYQSGMLQPLEPLPGAEQEAQKIASLLNAQALTTDAATKAAFLQKAASARIIHLATHGLLDNVDGLKSAIVLASSEGASGLLTAEEIFELNLKAELVVLSACNTARGRISGDGVVGLSRSLIAAGVSSVLVSLWSVPDSPTASLMMDFYQNLQHYPNKAEALRQAMLKAMKQYPNPRDWAAFTLIGEAE